MKAAPNARELDLTELGNARRIAEKFREQLRYVRPWKSWLEWDGTRWKRDEIGVQMKAAKEIVANLINEAADLAAQAGTSGDERFADAAAELLKWAKSSSRLNTLAASAVLAETEPTIAAYASAFDQNPWILNVTNGTIDLKTGELRPHRQEDWCTMLAPVEYDPEATCPRWDAFVSWMLPDPEVRSWFQRFVGYCLTGEVGEQIITFLHGGGDNGKSTALIVIKHVLGDYAHQGSPGLLMAPDHGNAEELGRRQRAVVKGRRLVLVQEIEAGRFLNEAQVKQLTGGETITAAKLYENESEIMPTHKIAVGTNYKPVVRGADHGIWRRIRIVPFPSKIAADQKDRSLPEKLKAEASGILAWMVRGCLAWQRDGLAPAPAMQIEAERYRKHEDRLGEFLDDHTTTGDGVPGADLYRRYTSWCDSRGEKPWTRRAFTDALVERGYPAGKHKGVRAILGLVLKAYPDASQ